MLKKILKLVLLGIACGCTISTLISLVGVNTIGYEWFTNAPRGYTTQAVAAMIVGIAWALPSLIYEDGKRPTVQQIMIHAGIGLGVYLPVAFYMQWIPMENLVMALIYMAIMIIIAFLIWCGFYLYYRGESKAINRQLRSREQEEETKSNRK